MLKNNATIAINVLYAKKEKIYPAYVSKYSSNREQKVIFLMISKEEKWYYVTVKTLLAFLREMTLKYNGDFYFLNCLHSFRIKNKLESHKKVCENENFLM